MNAASNADVTKKTVRGLAWNYLSHYSGKFLLFISTVILARLLTKDEYGVAGYAFVAISFLDIIADLGIGAALIYHRDNPKANSTAFWLGLVVGVAFFAVNWVFAPVMAMFFNDPRATDVIRLLGLTFPIMSLSNVQEALLRKSLNFKSRFIADFTRSISKGLFSVIFALTGFGAWSLVMGHVLGTAISVVAYWVLSPWKPSFIFSGDLIRPLLTYGGGIMGVNILSSFLLKVDYLFVGRYMGAEALGTYMLAFRIPELLILQLCGIVAAKVFFPLYAGLRDDPDAMGRTFLVTTRYMALVTTPLGLGLALVAEPLVIALFGDKWADAVPVTQAIALYSLFLAFSYNSGDVYKARGQTWILTAISAVRLVILVPVLWWTIVTYDSIAAVGWAQAAVALFSAILTLSVAMRMFKLPIRQVFTTFHPALVSGGLMSVAVLLALMATAALSPLLQLTIATLVGGLSYIGGLWWLQRDLVLQARRSLRAALGGRRSAA